MAMLHALLPTLAILLVCAASAAAECAWVLWFSHTTTTKNPTTLTEYGWQIISTSDTKSHCEGDATDQRTTAVKHGSSSEWTRELSKDTVVHRRRDGSAELLDRYLCLPDTVDPRGPKGSGQ